MAGISAALIAPLYGTVASPYKARAKATYTIGVIMDKTFVRRAFYILPPAKNASVKEWLNWRRLDEQAAHQAQQRFNQARKITLDVDTVSEADVAKVEGIHRQVPSIGFIGTTEYQPTERVSSLIPERIKAIVNQYKHARQVQIKRHSK